MNKPECVRENEIRSNFKIKTNHHSDFKIQMDNRIPAKRLNIMLINSKNNLS